MKIQRKKYDKIYDDQRRNRQRKVRLIKEFITNWYIQQGVNNMEKVRAKKLNKGEKRI